MTKRAILLEALASMPKDLAFMLRHKTETAVTHHRPAPEQWSMADVLTHLVTIEALYLARLQRILQEERPFLPYLHPETLPEPSPLPLPDLLANFSRARSQTLGFLQALKPGSWQRPAVHETLGPTTLRFMVQLLVEHDTEHLNQLVEIQQRTQTR